MKKICILKRKENTFEENNFYKNAIKKFKGNPVMVAENNLYELNDCCGIVITGGYSKGKLDDYLIKYALDNKLPLLGICQGMQSMAMYKSTKKLKKIANHYQNEGYVHDVYLDSSILSSIYSKKIIKVNSHHNEGVEESNMFKVVGRSADNLIEAIESSNHWFQIGVQWHPERMLKYDLDSNNLIKRFVEICMLYI